MAFNDALGSSRITPTACVLQLLNLVEERDALIAKTVSLYRTQSSPIGNQKPPERMRRERETREMPRLLIGCPEAMHGLRPKSPAASAQRAELPRPNAVATDDTIIWLPDTRTYGFDGTHKTSAADPFGFGRGDSITH